MPLVNSGSSMTKSEKSGEGKISPVFSAKLSGLQPDAKVVAILVLGVKGTGRKTGPRRSGAERKIAVDAVRKSAEEALPDIDDVLAHAGGRRLADHPNALGTVPVETTSAGLRGLALLEQVTAILEDQPLSLL